MGFYSRFDYRLMQKIEQRRQQQQLWMWYLELVMMLTAVMMVSPFDVLDGLMHFWVPPYWRLVIYVHLQSMASCASRFCFGRFSFCLCFDFCFLFVSVALRLVFRFSASDRIFCPGNTTTNLATKEKYNKCKCKWNLLFFFSRDNVNNNKPV